MRIVLILALLLVGCKHENTGFCMPGVDCPPDAVVSCIESKEACVCLNMMCVQCTVDDERNCIGRTPQCGDDNRCRACRANADCSSGACLDDGGCANANQVIYAAPNGVDTAGCGQSAGQNECSITQALIEVTPSRNVIRLGPGTYTVVGPDGLDFNTKSATVVARGAVITRAVPGPFMTVRSGQTLKLIGGTLRGPNGTDGLRCSNTGSKLFVHETTIDDMNESGIESDGCELTVSRSTIRNNDLGGINMLTVARVATITNNFVYLNGSLTSPVGGMLLLMAPGSKLEFNTVVSNTANANAASSGGIACDLNGYDAPRNLIYRNQGGIGGKVQVIGTCTFQTSYAMPADAIDENVVGFEKPNDAIPSFRLTASSPPTTIINGIDCRDEIDFEGDVRPQPAGGKCDYGADEYRMGQ